MPAITASVPPFCTNLPFVAGLCSSLHVAGRKKPSCPSSWRTAGIVSHDYTDKAALRSLQSKQTSEQKHPSPKQ